MIMTLILVILLIIGIVAAFALVLGGVSILVAFGDVIVFGLIVWLIWLIVKFIRRRRK